MPYSDAEALALLNCQDIPPDARMFIALAFYTGMREGEICGRRWRDLDTQKEPLWCLRVSTQYEDQPLKTDDADADHPRDVPVHAELQALLVSWWREGFELVYCRKPTPDDFIIPWRMTGRGRSTPGAAHTRASAYKMWCRACVVAGVANVSLHSTRHTFISAARRGGAAKDQVEKITHNAKPQDVLDMYTHQGWTTLCEAVASCKYDATPLRQKLDASEKVPAKYAKLLGLMVEAPGIEPGSENHTRHASTYVADILSRSEKRLSAGFFRTESPV